MKEFYDIYRQYPEITDLNAMTAFIKMEKVVRNGLDELDLIPEEVRKSLSLSFNDNLKPFVERYAKEYGNETIKLPILYRSR